MRLCRRSPVRWAEYRALVERSRFAVEFNAHPTFALPPALARALVETASGRVTRWRDRIGRRRSVWLTSLPKPRPPSPMGAMPSTGSMRLLSVAHGAWPDRWTELDPRPVILSSWVGYDTDGRTDNGWWDTLRLRLEM